MPRRKPVRVATTLKALTHPRTVAETACLTGAGFEDTQHRLRFLVEEGIAFTDDDGRYALTTEGLELIA